MRHPIVCGLLCAALLAGCTALPPGPPRPPESPQVVPSSQLLGRQLADAALALLGRPYEYGGNGPDTFDCSGLVRFVHNRFGIEAPRTTDAQFRAAHRVDPQDMAAGDLLFFRINSQSVSHVAIYLGDGRFIHAPQTGRPVETRGVDDAYYKSRLLRVGRLH